MTRRLRSAPNAASGIQSREQILADLEPYLVDLGEGTLATVVTGGDGTVSASQPQPIGVSRPNMVWIQVERQPDKVAAKYPVDMNLALLSPGMPVRVKKRRDGDWWIIGIDRNGADRYYLGTRPASGSYSVFNSLYAATATLTQARFASATELTIASGAVTKTQTWHTVDTEGDASSDELDTIAGGIDGDILVIRAADASRTVVVTENDNIVTGTGTSISLDSTDKLLWMLYDGALEAWVPLTGAGSGATTELDNLGTTAINTSLVSDTDNTDDLGSAAVHWRHTYTNAVTMAEGSAPSTPAANKWSFYFKTDGAYVKDDAGAETGPLGASGGATPSIISNTQTRVRLDASALASPGVFDLTSFSTSHEDLYMKCRLRGTGVGNDITYLFFNGDYATGNYHSQRGGGANGGVSNVEVTNPTAAYIPGSTSPAGAFAWIEIFIPDYASATFRKMAFVRVAQEYALDSLHALIFMVHWDSTAPITRITLQPDGYATDTFDTGSTCKLYGVSDIDQVTNVT